MKYLICIVLIFSMKNGVAQKSSSPEILEIGNNNFIYYYSIESYELITDSLKEYITDENFTISDKNVVIKSKDNNKFLAFQNGTDYRAYEQYKNDLAKNLKSYHIFFNRNKYADRLLPKNAAEIIYPFLKTIGCREKSLLNQLKYVNDYAMKLNHSLYFFRKNIAEISLLIYLFYLEKFPKLEYNLKYEDSTYVPYLVYKGREYFVLGNLLELLFTDNDFNNTLVTTMEFEYSKLLNIF